jgi:hypothetical protein
VLDCLAAMNTKTMSPTPYSPVIATADYFLFTNMKVELAAISKTQETFHKAWDGVQRTVAKWDFVTAFRRWKLRSKKCI